MTRFKPELKLRIEIIRRSVRRPACRLQYLVQRLGQLLSILGQADWLEDDYELIDRLFERGVRHCDEEKVGFRVRSSPHT